MESGSCGGEEQEASGAPIRARARQQLEDEAHINATENQLRQWVSEALAMQKGHGSELASAINKLTAVLDATQEVSP